MDTAALLERQTTTLRAWFIAFGVGAPALVLTNEKLYSLLLASGRLDTMMASFLVGVGAQILEAWLNRFLNLVIHLGERDPAFASRRVARVAAVISRQIWIDALLDLLTIGALGYASWGFLSAVAAAA